MYDKGIASRMKDIARDLGMSVITVSKVLRDHPDISEATRDRVLRRMKELNYRPNLAAPVLVTGRTHCVGLVVPDLVHPFFAELAKSISQVLRERGYGLLISSSEEKADLCQCSCLLLEGTGMGWFASGVDSSCSPPARSRSRASCS
jgi:DNA-binding LacI/PurR family transcriptional regulator